LNSGSLHPNRVGGNGCLANFGLVIHEQEFVGGSAARKEWCKAMALSEQEKARIREEELTHWQARKESKRRKRPQLIIWTVLWTILLLVLAFASPHLHF
jgi:antibiotic biosynthesis monooxygenase (ABM) superfamily enzyme